MAGIKLLRQYKVPFNILTTLHAANAEHPLEVYRFLRDEVRTQHIQFIPIVEHTPGLFGGVSDRSVTGKQYGDFLIAVFSEWVRHDERRVLESSLAWLRGRSVGR